MKQLLLFIFLSGIYSLNSFGQDIKNGCSKKTEESIPGDYSDILPLENPENFEKDSIIFLFPDSLKEGSDYIYIINRKEQDLFFSLSTLGPNTPNIIQEALDSNGNWIAIEDIDYHYAQNYPPVKLIQTNQYIAFTKHFYKEGNYCTKIRFKLIGKSKNYYSQPYDGCINSCLLIPYKEEWSCTYPAKKSKTHQLFEIYKSDKLPNEEKIKWVKNNWDEKYEKSFTQVALALYRKMKDYENAFYYAERLVKINPNSGKGYLYKGDFYIVGTKECYPEPESIWVQQLSIHLALEEWNKAKKFSDSKEEAEKRINRYTHYAFQSEGCIGLGGGLNPNKTFHIGCWINRTVKYK